MSKLTHHPMPINRGWARRVGSYAVSVTRGNKTLWIPTLIAIVLVIGASAQNGRPAEQLESQPTVDAPSAIKPQSTLPTPPVSPRDTSNDQNAAPHPSVAPANPDTRPDSDVPADISGAGREEIFRLTKDVNFIQIPVSVKDENGKLVSGLLSKDFAVFEDGVPQRITYFTSDPFPLSAAVVVDLSMADVEVEKIRKTLPALVGSFSDFDEVTLYSFGGTVRKMQDFTSATGNTFSASMARLKKEQGSAYGAPVMGGPFGQPAPTVNGRSIDPSVPPWPVMYRPEPRVLNDAILQAALELAKREPTRRKILFLISEGREYGSKAGSEEVMKVLLSNQISVYAIGIGGSAIPLYGKLSEYNVPGTGSGNLLQKYASATGGQVYTEISESSMESAYSRLTSEARNQYTLGYSNRSTPSSVYRGIEVVVHRPGLKVYARDGYYPLPPRRTVPDVPQ